MTRYRPRKFRLHNVINMYRKPNFVFWKSHQNILKTSVLTGLLFFITFQIGIGQCGLSTTGVWTGGPGDGPYNTTLATVPTQVEFTTPGNSAITGVSLVQTLTTTDPSWFTNSAAGNPALRFEVNWDETPENFITDIDAPGDDKETGTMTITFDEPMACVILHVDRVGGVGFLNGVDTVTNSSEWTVTTPGITLQKLSGTDDLMVTATTFFKTPDIDQGVVVNAEAAQNDVDGTAAGSIKLIDATGMGITSVSFDWTGIGIEGNGGDAVELAICGEAISQCPPSCTAAEAAPATCALADGSATATPSGGFAPYTFLWDNGETTQTATMLIAGPHTVTVTDAFGNVTDCNVTVSSVNVLTCTAVQAASATCGLANGSATATPANATGVVTFLWDNGETTATATMLTPGLHTVQVTDDNGCISSCSVTIADACGPVITLTKTADASGLSTPPVDGETITYTFEVCNTGNVALTNITVSDPIVVVAGGPLASLAIGACDQLTFTATYNITMADIGAGVVNNTAMVSGLDPTGGPVTSSAPATVPLTASAAISLVKTADASGLSSPPVPGEVITYTFEVCNTGNLDLTNVSVSDPIVTVAGATIASLPVGTCDATSFSGTYAITMGDIAAGVVNNTATTNGLDPSGSGVSASDPANVPLAAAAGIMLTKTADASGVSMPPVAGEIITYTFEVCNIGNVALTNVSVSDPIVTVAGGPIASLPVGTCDAVTFTGSVAISMTDIANGMVANTATANGLDPAGAGVNDMDTQNVPLMPSAAIELFKVGDASGISVPAIVGETITYAFEVCNTGNVDLTNVSVADAAVTVLGGPLALLAVGTCDAVTFTGSYNIVAADIANGEFENSATTSGTDPNGTVVTDVSDDPSDLTNIDSNNDGEPDDPTVVPLSILAQITLDKVANTTGLSVPAVVGDVITYTFEVCNTGNVALTNVLVSDPLVVVTGGPLGSLAVGACDNLTFTGSYAITLADIGNGAVNNTAMATGTDPDGAMTSATDPADVDLAQAAGIGITKMSDASALQSPAEVGDLITYTFEVCNTGNVNLTNVLVVDPIVTVSGGPLASLAVATCDNVTFTATYQITANDITNGMVTNVATASGIDPDGDTVTEDSPAEVVPLDQQGTISLEKIGDDSAIGNPATVGDIISYAFVVCNTGNVALTNIVIDDPDVNVSGASINLAPGACDGITFSGTYALTSADIIAGMFINSAMVTGQDPAGNPVVDISDDPTNPTDVDPNMDGNPDDPTVVTFGNCECPATPGSLTSGWNETSPGVYESALETNNVTFSVGTGGNTAISAVPNGTFNGLGFDYWTSPATIGINSLETLFTWDTSPDGFQTDIDGAGDDKGTGTLEICFDEPILNPVIHIDRLGGAGSQAVPTTNSAEFILTTPGLSLTRLSGTFDFEVTGTSIRKTPDVMGTISNPEATNMPEDGTAAGSVIVNGLVTCVEFSWTGIGVEGNGSDGIEWAFGTIEQCICDIECPALVCNDNIQISLGLECNLEITPDMVLEAPVDGIVYDVQIFDLNGNNIGNMVNGDLVGSTFQYKVVSECDGNSCWGTITLEANIVPMLNSPCEFTAGETVLLEGTLSAGNTTESLTITVGDPCQSIINIIGFTDLKYNSGTGGNPIWSFSDVTVSVFDASGNLVTPPGNSTFSNGAFGLNVNVPSTGTYTVVISSVVGSSNGDFTIQASVPDCGFSADCIGWCGSGVPDAFITVEEAQLALDNGCGAQLVGDITVMESTNGEICDENGEIHVISYTATITMHGVTQKVVLLTQAYSTEKIDISPNGLQLRFPPSLDLDCDEEISSTYEIGSPGFIEALTGSGAAAYPSFTDIHTLVPDSSIVESKVHIEEIVGTREEMVLQLIDLNGDGVDEEVWTLVTVVDKILRDSVVLDTIVDGFTNPLVPIRNQVCNLIVTYDDLVFDACAGGQKIFRTWTVLDWCDGSIQQEGTQTIEVSDQTAPVAMDPDDQLVSIDPWVCSAKVRLPAVDYTDNCSSTVDVQWSTAEGTITEGFIIDLWPDQSPITVTGLVVDECGNTTQVSFDVAIDDYIPPVVVCQSGLQVSLTVDPSAGEGGIAKIYSDAFDAGSHDAGCGEVSLQVVRLDDWTELVTNCLGEVVGYKPTSCDPHTASVDLGSVPTGKNDPCDYDGSNVGHISQLGDFVKFCCNDVGQTIMVVLVVTDAAGNQNQCMVEVFVQDKTAAAIICEPITVSCTSDMEHMPSPVLIGAACDGNQIELLNEDSASAGCGAGSITKEWFVDLDGSGDLSPGDPYCQQIITIEQGAGAFDPSTIKWPKHHDGTVHVGVNLECNALGEVEVVDNYSVDMGDAIVCVPDDSDVEVKPIWCDPLCGLVGYSVDIDTVFASDACLKIIKHWTVVDWCTWESNGDDTDDENDTANDNFEAVEDWAQGVCADCDNGYGPVHDDPIYFRYTSFDRDGYYTYDQVIKVIDDSAPVIDAPAEITVNTTGGATSKDDPTPCTGSDIITATVEDLCAGVASGSAKVEWYITVSKNGEIVSSKTSIGATATMNSQEGEPGDEHVIRWRAQDGCGNVSTAITVVSFGDQKAPTPFCVSGLTTAFMASDGSVTVWGSEFDFGSFDNCCPAEDLRFSIVQTDVDPIRPGETGFGSEGSLTFSCADFTNFAILDIWVWDCVGNGDFCTVSILLNGDCPEQGEEGEEGEGSSAMISGQIETFTGDMMENVDVSLASALPEYPLTDQTDGFGMYAFGNNPMTANYSIKANKEDSYINGVSTVDLVLIQKHIINITLLDSPYKIIAADANNDQRVSASDLVELRKLILGIYDELPRSKSWKFVKADFQFFDPMDPWPFIEVVEIINLEQDMMQEDFLGVKIGDVNGNAAPNNAMPVIPRSNGKLTLEVEDKVIKAGEIVNIPFASNDFTNIAGYQFTMDHDGLELMNISGAQLELDENSIGVRPNTMTMSWFKENNVTVEGDLFNLTFKAQKDVVLSQVLNINSDITRAEAYRGAGLEYLDVAITFTGEELSTNEVTLYQNEPNPFRDETSIGFSLPKAADVDLTIMDLSGKELKTISKSFDKGYNQITISKNEINQTGVIYYKLESGDFTQTRKMILFK